jgi:hypothetical protein
LDVPEGTVNGIVYAAGDCTVEKPAEPDFRLYPHKTPMTGDLLRKPLGQSCGRKPKLTDHQRELALTRKTRGETIA